MQSIGLVITVLRGQRVIFDAELAAQHDSFSHTTRTQLKQVFNALRQLMVPPDPPKRSIGFVTPQDKSN